MSLEENQENLLLPYEYVETEPYENGFAEYYKKHIVPLAEDYNASKAINALKNGFNITIALVIGIAGSLGIAKSGMLAHARGRKSGLAIFLPPLASWWYFVQRPRRKYFNTIKEDVLPLILKFMGDFQYEPSKKLPSIMEDHIRDIGRFPYEDVISYTKEGINCKIFERAIRDLKKYISSIYIFLELPERINFDFIVISKKRQRFEESREPSILSKNSIQKSLLNRRNFEEDPITVNDKFDQYFSLYTSNFDESPISWFNDDFVAALIAFDSAFNGYGIKFSVKPNSVLLVIFNNQNSFEVGDSYKDIAANANNIKTLLKELNLAFNAVDIISKKIRGMEKMA